MLVRNQLYCCLCVGILMMNVSLPTLIWLVQFPYRRQELWLTLWITYGIGVQANMLKWYPQIILGRFSFHLPNFLIGPNYFKITQMQENVPSEVLLFFFFFSISYFGWLHKSGKMKWSVCRHEERIIEFNFSSVSKLVWICHILFPAKHFFSLKKFQPTYWWDWSWAFSVPKSCPEPDWNKPWPVQKFFTSRAFYVGLEMAGWLRRHSLPKNSSVSPTVFFFNV